MQQALLFSSSDTDERVTSTPYIHMGGAYRFIRLLRVNWLDL
jgi:hypothetical protein